MRVKLHLRTDKEPCQSLSGWAVFRVACGRWVILAATTDDPKRAECGNCRRRKRV